MIKREHLLVGNVARRLLRVIRDEFQHEDDETPAAAGDGDDATTRTRRMKKDVIDTAHEVIEEMEAGFDEDEGAGNVSARIDEEAERAVADLDDEDDDLT